MIEIFFDGACQPWNPGGLASYGFVVSRAGSLLEEGKGMAAAPGTPQATNNVAEYTGMVKGVEAVRRHIQEGEKLLVQGDSQLAIRQMTGQYAVNAEHLRPLHAKASFMVSELRVAGHPVDLMWVPREKNAHADRLSNEAVQEALAANPSALDEAVVGFGMHKGKRFGDLPKGYRDWLWSKKK